MFFGGHNMFRVEHNVETGKIEKIELSAVEIEELEKSAEESIAKAIMEQAETEAKAAARQAILDRLGLSEEEAKILLG
jgi:hypothetical protein